MIMMIDGNAKDAMTMVFTVVTIVIMFMMVLQRML